MGTSIAAGAARVSPQSNSLMVLFCDQWRVRKEDLESLLETWQSEPERIVCARAEGRNMPPVIFPSRYFRQLQALNGRRGAHALLTDHASRLTPVSLKNAAFDLDTKDDLDDLKSHEL
jgi:molybdenum cofactor cytidylyltransferase